MATKARATDSKNDGFINLPVTKKTREGLHKLKDAMDARSQAEVIAKLVKMGLAVHDSLT